jgi:glycosyltransferase involved in cell wall biosynthesis
MLRNYDEIVSIIALSPEIHFHIFVGRGNILIDRYKDFPNVTIHVNIKETKLRAILHSSDISLNVMQYTVGSNAIVTAIASGLAMVCSDVGSIRDYVSPESGILFNSIGEAVEALNRLNNDRELLYALQKKSLVKAEELDIKIFPDWWHRDLIAGLD